MSHGFKQTSGACLRRLSITVATHTILVILAGFGCRAHADEASTRRGDQLTAAYLFNFVKFIEWPPATAPTEILMVCFVGGQGVQDALASGIERKHVGTRPLAVRRLQGSAAAEGCNVLYLDAAVARDTPRFGADGLPILTVSNAKAFARSGGMIELFTDSNRLRFSINVDNAQKAGLRISSSLLQLAAAIEKGNAP